MYLYRVFTKKNTHCIERVPSFSHILFVHTIYRLKLSSIDFPSCDFFRPRTLDISHLSDFSVAMLFLSVIAKTFKHGLSSPPLPAYYIF